MDEDPKRPPRPLPDAAKASARGPVAGRAFDLWLNHRLHQLYDSVAQEPIPPELLRLIEEDRSRRSG